MNSHLVIKLDGREMALKPDQSIEVVDQNPLFNNVEMYSYPFEPPFELNREIFKNLDDPDSDMRPVELEHKKVQIIAEGLPLRKGVSVIQEDETLESGMSMNIDASERSFEDLIGDLKCRDVPLKDRIQIGEKIGNVHVQLTYSYQVKVQYEGKKGDREYIYSSDTVEGDFEPQALGFSYPGVCQVTGNKQMAVKKTQKEYPGGNVVIVPKEATNYANPTFINVTDEYGANSDHWGAGGAKYCNARVCYKHYGLDDDCNTSSEVVQLTDYNQDKARDMYEDHYPYWVLEADRPQSGICFYVLYFLDCLFAHLGVSFNKDALTAIEDFKHLCFFTTKCKYDTEVITDAGYPTFYSMEDANDWLESRGCGGRFGVEDPEAKQIQSFDYTKNGGAKQTVKVGKDGVQSITVTATINNAKNAFSANICRMWANSDNFPEESVKAILDSLESSFGIRFHYDYEKNSVTAYLLRDVFRSQSAPINFSGEVLSVHKMTEKITGFRMKYSAEGTAKEQADYIRRGKRDYNTDFDYSEYPQGRVVLDKTFVEIASKASATNMNVYVDRTTGNAYRFKVDSETLSQARLFEVGQFKGVEVGDCGPENDDFIREYVSDFQPISFNDVNAWRNMGTGGTKEYTYVDGNDTYKFMNIKAGGQPMLVAYVDEDMEHEFVEQRINNVLSSDLVDIYLTEYLKTVESYDPTKTDDGNSPLQEYDWGLAIAIMRGGGTNMEFQRYDSGYDGFGNDKWRTVAGEYALTSDTMDQMGNVFDYNGVDPGIGYGERFSLKITGYRPFRYKVASGQTIISTNPAEWDSTWLIPCDSDITNPQTGEVEEKIRTRGLFDTFMAELCHFLLHRKKYRIRVLTTVAQLADIPNHWKDRFIIYGRIGYIDKVRYKLEVEKETREAEIEFYSI